MAKPIRERLDTTGFALPKPGTRKKSQPKDGRLVESRSQYSRSKHAMWIRQQRLCACADGKGKICGKFMPSPAHGHRHHPGGRGLGGSKRDDSKTVLWCIECHLEEHK